MATIISITQPGDWAWHHHIQRGEYLGGNAYQATDLIEELRKIRIPYPASDLRMIPATDYLPFEKAPTQLIPSDPNYPTSERMVRFPLKPSSTGDIPNIIVQWVRYQWIALRQQREKCPYCDFVGERYVEAYSLDKYCAKKIIEAYGISEDIISVEEVIRTSPSDLALMGEYKSQLIEITFERAYYDHYNPDPLEVVKIPVGGELPQIPEDIRHGYIKAGGVQVSRNPIEEVTESKPSLLAYEPFTEIGYRNYYAIGAVQFNMKGKRHRLMQLRWVKERNEWVAIAYGREGFTVHSEWYDGPFTLDDYCVERLMQAYGLLSGKLTSQEYIRMEPAELARVALKN